MLETRRWGWAVSTAASGTVLIGLGAFWLSFVALADLARRSGIAAGQAWVWPLLVDGLIVVATIAVVALDGHTRAWYPWTLLIAGAVVSVIANAMHSLVAADTSVPGVLVAADASVPGVLAAAVASVPPLVLLASTHLTVVLIRSAHRREPAGMATPEAPATAEPPADSPGADQSDAQPEGPEISRPPTSAVNQPHPLPELAIAHPPTPADISPDDDHEAPAPGTVSTPPTDAPAEGVESRQAEAARLRAQGWSNRKIAAHMQVHPSTVGRWHARGGGNESTNTETSEESTS